MRRKISLVYPDPLAPSENDLRIKDVSEGPPSSVDRTRDWLDATPYCSKPLPTLRSGWHRDEITVPLPDTPASIAASSRPSWEDVALPAGYPGDCRNNPEILFMHWPPGCYWRYPRQPHTVAERLATPIPWGRPPKKTGRKPPSASGH